MSFNARTPPTAQELAAASKLSVYNAEGNEVRLGSLLDNVDSEGREKAAIVIFIRHFFCGLCQEYLAYLTSHLPLDLLEERHIKLSVIGCGAPSLIAPYRENLGTHFDIYADPTKKSYEALGMTLRTLDMGKETPEYQKTGFLGNIFGSIASVFRMGGKAITSNAGDIKQLGGEFVFYRGEPIYTHRMENTRGHAPLEELFKAAGIPLTEADYGVAS